MSEATRQAVLDAIVARRQADLNVEIMVQGHTAAVADELGLAVGMRVFVNDPLGAFSSTIAGFRMDADALNVDDLWVRAPSPQRLEDLFRVEWISRHQDNVEAQ